MMRTNILVLLLMLEGKHSVFTTGYDTGCVVYALYQFKEVPCALSLWDWLGKKRGAGHGQKSWGWVEDRFISV